MKKSKNKVGSKPKEEKNSAKPKVDKAAREREIQEIFQEASKGTSEQMVIDSMGNIQTEDELKYFSLGNIPDDPSKKYDVYYKGIEKLLKLFLPKGEKSKLIRTMIREEKKLYLTRGKKLNSKGIRGADSRMGYISDMETMMNLITEWAFKSRNYSELYFILRNKNIELGYHPSESSAQA